MYAEDINDQLIFKASIDVQLHGARFKLLQGLQPPSKQLKKQRFYFIYLFIYFH